MRNFYGLLRLRSGQALKSGPFREATKHLAVCEALLSAEAVNDPGVYAEVTLQVAGRSARAGLEGGSCPGRRKAEGEVRVKVSNRR